MLTSFCVKYREEEAYILQKLKTNVLYNISPTAEKTIKGYEALKECILQVFLIKSDTSKWRQV